ncbi:MAG: hypothetical protein EAZ92_02920 [Candidatus Kapaibacterium sp.]|nr:MAG: hypothetical protein EAZ92_02920 [Candidatus Kapabacteria bacterium]
MPHSQQKTPQLTLLGYGEHHGKTQIVEFVAFQDEVVVVKSTTGAIWKFRAKDGFPLNVLGAFTGWQLDIRDLKYC